MKPPSSTATREALNNPLNYRGSAFETIVEAARFAALILPDDNGEWSEEVVDAVIGAVIYGGSHHPMVRRDAKAVLAELVRLAEGSDE
jgi:hypothetical protein